MKAAMLFSGVLFVVGFAFSVGPVGGTETIPSDVVGDSDALAAASREERAKIAA
jgi:hypothetical protein